MCALAWKKMRYLQGYYSPSLDHGRVLVFNEPQSVIFGKPQSTTAVRLCKWIHNQSQPAYNHSDSSVSQWGGSITSSQSNHETQPASRYTMCGLAGMLEERSPLSLYSLHSCWVLLYI